MESKAKKIMWLLYPAAMGVIWYTQFPRILSMTGTTVMQYFVMSLVSVLSIAILNLLRFRLPDYLLLFSVIFMVVSKTYFIEGFSDFLIFFLHRLLQKRASERQSFVFMDHIYPVCSKPYVSSEHL